MMIRILLSIFLSMTAACAGIAPGERPGTPELNAFGCYASMAGWLSFGDPERADTVVRSWLILDLRRAREYPNLHVARFVGTNAAVKQAMEKPQLGVWSLDGDSIHIWWHNGFHGVDLHVSPEGDALQGRARSTSDVLERDSAGILAPITSTALVRAARVLCEQVPAGLERRTRNQEPFLGMPIIEPR